MYSLKEFADVPPCYLPGIALHKNSIDRATIHSGFQNSLCRLLSACQTATKRPGQDRLSSGAALGGLHSPCGCKAGTTMSWTLANCLRARQGDAPALHLARSISRGANRGEGCTWERRVLERRTEIVALCWYRRRNRYLHKLVCSFECIFMWC